MQHWKCAILAALTLLSACVHPGKIEPEPAEYLVYFGTRLEGPGAGISGGRFDARSGTLKDVRPVAEIFRPTWLHSLSDESVLFSVSESGNDGLSEARVFAYRVDRASGGLTALGNASSGGGGATHLAYDQHSRSLFVANFGSGSIAVLPVDAQGLPGGLSATGETSGTGPHRRQVAPHPHGATVDASGRYVLVPDLGADRVFIFRFDPDNRSLHPAETPFVQAPAGSGPRHLEFGSDHRFAYLLTDISGHIIIYRWDPQGGRLSQIHVQDLMPEGYTGDRSAAELAISSDGRFLYASTRGTDNAMVVFAIDRPTGGLTEIQRFPVGNRPWSHAISPDGRWLLVAEEGDNRVSVASRDPVTGRLTATDSSVEVLQPTNVTFVR